MTMSATQKKVGKDYYVFTKGNASKCVIDSHGGRPLTKPYFSVPSGMCIFFYVHRHTFLMAAEEKTCGVWFVDAVNQIVKGDVSSVESFKPNQSCPDYLLEKQHKSATKTKSHRYEEIGYAEVSDYVTRRVPADWAVVSVRNRAGRNAYLSDAATLLVQQGFREIHCCFCRGGLWDNISSKGKFELAGGTKYTG